MNQSDYKIKEEQILESYESLKPKLHEWGSYIDAHIIELLEVSGVNQFHIEILPKYRIKTDNSLINKVLYRSNGISDPMMLNDKVGTRIVLTHLEDVKNVREIILNHLDCWTPECTRDLGKTVLLNPKTFDYDSVHINLTPKNECNLFRTFNSDELLYYVCELQIRTLTQHAYAQVAHDTIYKGPFSEHGELIHTLSTTMALIEVTDRYFVESINKMESDSEYEKAFLNRLISIGKDYFNYDFLRESIDNILISDFFKIANIQNINIDDVTRVLVSDESDVKNLLTKLTGTYMSHQPIILLIAYLILSGRSDHLHKIWPYNQDLYREMVSYLGVTPRY